MRPTGPRPPTLPLRRRRRSNSSRRRQSQAAPSFSSTSRSSIRLRPTGGGLLLGVAALFLLLVAFASSPASAFVSTSNPHPMLRLSRRASSSSSLRALHPLLPSWRRPTTTPLPLLTALAATSTTATRASKTKKAAPAKKRAAAAGASRRGAAGAEEEGIGAMHPGAKLVIVESATKANTIRRYLPSDEWEVDFCMGHVRELPRSMSDLPPGAKEKFKVLGVRVDQAYEPVWVVLPGREGVVNRLRAKAKACSELYLATDEDREGEAISWHLLDLLNPDASRTPVHRVIFHEITPNAVGAGLENPRPIDQNLVEAQHARRVLDRVAGYTMSPLLWKKIATGLSAGRVQSAGLKLLVDRERERMLFKPAHYAGLKAAVQAQGWGTEADARLQALNGKRVAVGGDFNPRTGKLQEKKEGSVAWLTEEAMGEVAQVLADQSTAWVVRDVESKIITRKRPAPFTTSTLQQEANSRFGLSSSQTMKLAQELYEEGFISYMRTDSPNMGPEALAVAHKQATELFGGQDVGPDALGGRGKNAASATAQEAHEAIRPSITDAGRFRHPREVAPLMNDKKKHDLYTLIFDRTLASVMKDAKLERKTVSIDATNRSRPEMAAELVLTGQSVLVQGFLRALQAQEQEQQQEGGDNGEGAGAIAAVSAQELSMLQPGQALRCSGAKVLAHTTSPPFRFTQGSFVRMVEELGIGRPSTYATIIEVLKTRRYFAMKGTAMVPTLLGFVVIQLLERHFPDFVDAGFTSRMEAALDEIAQGKVDRAAYLDDYYRGLISAIDLVSDAIDRKSAKRVLLSTLGDTQCGVFVGPYGPYVRDLLPGEPTDAALLGNEEAARSFYQDLWADDDAGFLKSAAESRRAPIPAEMANDPASITREALERLLDMSVQGKGVVLGPDPVTGADIILRATKSGRSLEVQEGDTLRKVQVPQSVDAANCPPELAARLLREFPRSLGVHPTFNDEMVLNLGHFPNLRVGNRSFGLLTQSVAELMEFSPADALQLVATGKATFYLGDHKNGAMWFVPKGRYSYPHIRWNQLKIYLKDGELGPNGGPPTPEVAVALVEAKEGSAGGGRGRGGGGGGKKEPPPKKEKATRSPSAFLLFTKEMRPTLAAGLPFAEQQKALSDAWKALPEAEKSKYITSAEELKAAAGGGKGKKTSAGSDEGPKLPRSAYALFCNEERPQLAKGLNVAEQAKELSARWKGLGEDGKAAVAKRLEEMKSAAAATAGGGSGGDGGGGGT